MPNLGDVLRQEDEKAASEKEKLIERLTKLQQAFSTGEQKAEPTTLQSETGASETEPTPDHFPE